MPPPRDLLKARLQSKQRYDRLRAAGTCTRCADGRALKGKSLCRRCLESQQTYAKQRSRDLLAVPRPVARLPVCAGPLALPGAKGYLRGSIAAGYQPGSIARRLLGIVRDPWVGR